MFIVCFSLNSRELERDRRARDAENTHGLRLHNGHLSQSVRHHTATQVSVMVEREVFVDGDNEDGSTKSVEVKSPRKSYFSGKTHLNRGLSR